MAPSQEKRGSLVPKSSMAPKPGMVEVDAIADGRIFVSIAAYDDPELPNTMLSLLSAAERPELIHFGIVWQGPGSGFAAEDLSELAKFWTAEVNERFVTDMQLPHGSVPLWEMLDGRVRSIRMAAEDARGPCWARYLAQLLWEKEELQLQLDSHMRFVPGWDTKARDELKFCSQTSEKPILCSYGAGYSLGTPYWETPKGSSQTSVNCANTFDSDGILLIKARELKAPLDEPRKHYFWGAQFSFSSADVLCEVPYDPQLQMLFFGEEILMAVRFFTHGWDVFTPKEQLFFHLWERDYRRVYWKDNRELFASLLKESQCRVLSQLDSGRAVAGTERWPLPGGGVSNPEKDHFSLGTHRTLEDYQVAAGVNFREKRLEARALRGGDNHHREDDFKEAMVLQKPPLTLSDTPEELHSIAGATFSSDALVNARSSYVAQTDTERFVLWYSTTNQTWLLNAGGVAHGLGQEARPVLFSESTHDEPTDVRQWYYFDAYMRRWLPSPSLQFQLKEEVEEAESWWNALLKPVPLVELR